MVAATAPSAAQSRNQMVRAAALAAGIAAATLVLALAAQVFAQPDSKLQATVANVVIGVAVLLIALNFSTAGWLQRLVRTVALIALGGGAGLIGISIGTPFAEVGVGAGVAIAALAVRQWFSDARTPRQRLVVSLVAGAAMLAGIGLGVMSLFAAEPWHMAAIVAIAGAYAAGIAMFAAGRVTSQSSEFGFRIAAGAAALVAGIIIAIRLFSNLAEPWRQDGFALALGVAASTLLTMAAAWRESARLRRGALVLLLLSIGVVAVNSLSTVASGHVTVGAIGLLIAAGAVGVRLARRWNERASWAQLAAVAATFLTLVALDFLVIAVSSFLPDQAVQAEGKLLWGVNIGTILMVISRWLPPRLGYVVRRLILGAITIAIVTLLVFFLLNLLPDKWWQHIVYAKNNTPERQAILKHQLGVDQPPLIQYVAWLNGLLQWPPDLGVSGYYHDTVVNVIKPHVIPTLILLGTAYLLQLLISIPIGIISAVKQYSKLDNTVMAAAFVGISMPNYWFGSMLIFFLAVVPYQNGHGLIFPAGGECSTATLGSTHFPQDCWHIAGIPEQLWYLALPAVVLAVQGIAAYARFVRGSMLDVLHQDFVRTAKAKGLSTIRVVLRHAFRNSLLPLITLIGIDLPSIFAGAIITEFVFNWPGMGQLSVNEVNNADVTVVIGILLILSVLIVIGSIVADLCYTLADPRIRYGEER